jgi:very-short-patch-repair endonuclease
MECRRRQTDDAEAGAAFTADWVEENIKNLETVQGDERDVIIFSVGYGPDETGKLSLNFGPLNRAGGQRRLNVAVTRAREQVILVSSVLPEQIDLARTSAQGLRLLRQYMLVARDGMAALAADERADEDAEFGSPFEESIYNQLSAQGLAMDRQVGVSGYRIDLGVKHPTLPGRYVMGIECDGRMYHSAATARDRDRLRQQVLESLGWKLHRIWSSEWYSRRETEIARVIRAYLDAVAEDSHGIDNTGGGTSSREIVSDPPEEFLEAAPQAREGAAKLPGYVFENPTSLPVRWAGTAQVLQAKSRQVEDDVVQVVQQHAPVHYETVIEDVARAWGFRRIGANVRSGISQAIRTATAKRRIVHSGDFLWLPGAKEVIVRAPRPGSSPRKIERIPVEEISQAAYLCLTSARSLGREDLAKAAGPLLGYQRLGMNVADRIERGIDLLVTSGRASQSEGKVRLTRPTSS